MSSEMECPADLSILLADTFKSKPEYHTRAIYFLSKSQVEGVANLYIRSLQNVVGAPAVFKEVVERMVQDTMTEGNDRIFRKVMKDIWNDNVLRSGSAEELHGSQRGQLVLTNTSLSASFVRNLDGLPSESLAAIWHVVYSIACLDTGDAEENRAAFSTVLVPLNSSKFKGSEEARVPIERSERDRTKIIMNYCLLAWAAVASGVGGNVIFAGLGKAFGPLGFIIGISAIAIRGSGFLLYGQQYSRRTFFDKIFNLPETEELENAYNILGVSPNASDSQISSRFRQLALQHHPDKNGCSEKWHRIKNAITVIRENRIGKKIN